MYVGQWPSFHGPVILSYLEDVLKEEWCTEGLKDLKLHDAKVPLLFLSCLVTNPYNL